MKNRKKLIYALLAILTVELVFLLITSEPNETAREAFERQTANLSPIQRVQVAKSLYFSQHKRQPTKLEDLAEYLDVAQIRRTVSENDLATVFTAVGAKKGSVETDLQQTLEYFQKRLLGAKPPMVQFASLRDPFRPYDPNPLEGATQSKSPLETFDISEMTLTAVVESEGSLKGYVTVPTGQGFMVSKGDTIGRNGGQVVEVFVDKVVVMESFKDYTGAISTRTREIHLRGR